MFLTHTGTRGRAASMTAALALGIGAGLWAPAPAAAQDGARHLTLLGIPSATTAPGGSAFASLSLASEREGVDDDSDGSLALGIGLGDANLDFGLQLTAQITSLTDAFADSGYLGVKVARRIAAGRTPTYLAFSVDRIARWGDSEDTDAAADLVLTGFHAFETQGGSMPVMFSLGIGTHVRDSRTEPGAYAGIGVGLSQRFAASASYYGDYATFGVSYAPPGNKNISLSASLVDAFDQRGDQRAVVSFNWLLPKAFGGQ